MSIKDLHKKLMTMYFVGTQPDGYDLFNYYGVMIMKYKRNGQYQIKLQYDYKNRNMINGSAVHFSDFDAALKAYQILEQHSKFGLESTKQDEMEAMLLDN